MPGLLEENKPPGQNPLARQNIRQEGAALSQGQAPSGGPGQQQQANPEQQKLYNAYVGNGMKIIHGENTRDTIVEMLKGRKPVDATADTTLMVMKKLDTDSKSQAVKIPKEIKLHAGNALMGEIIDVGEASGAYAKPLSAVEREAAMRIAVGKYGQAGVESGEITSRELSEAAQAAEQVYPEFENEVNQMAGSQKQQQPQQQAPQPGPQQQPQPQAPQPGAQQQQAPPPQWGPKNG